MQRRVDELESFFKQFPLVPPEVIVKDDLLRLGLNFAPSSLLAAEGCRVKSYRLFTYDRVKHDDLGQGEPFKVPEDLDIIRGPYSLRRTNVQVRINPDSPYRVEAEDGKVFIREGDNVVAEAEYPKAPKYYSMAFDDGTKYAEVVAMAHNVAFCTLYRVCQYWGEKAECKFCDINENIRQGRKSKRLFVPKAFKPLEQVVEVMEEIFLRGQDWGEKRPIAVILTGGAILTDVNGRKEQDFYLRYVEAIREKIGYRWPLTLQTGPKTKAEFKRFKEAGVTCHHSQLEVWDKDLFKVLCPGKQEHLGWEEWIRRLVDSVEVMGEGNVTPGLVAGVEMSQPYGFKDVSAAVRSTAAGFDFLMSHGVIARYNLWNISPLSALAGNEPPPLEFYVRLDMSWSETWTKYKLPCPTGFGPMGPGLATNSHSSYMDMDPVLLATGRKAAAVASA